ncbi:MAG: hypothetical protein AAGI01_08935 [Myxococcota bacterium]
MKWLMGLLTVALCALSVCGTSSPASASPWTLPQHELVLSSNLSFARADEEFLQRDGSNPPTRQAYALNGVFTSASLNLSTRYGFTDRFEMEAQVAIKQVSYEADPVIIEAAGFVGEDTGSGNTGDRLINDGTTLGDVRRGVIDFDAQRFGPADGQLFLRYNLLRRAVVITPELKIKLPLGYDGPQGTFESIPPESGTFIVADDAVLGDGQIDVQGSMLFGTYIPISRTFIRADVGYNFRADTPGDQLVANAKAGQFLGDSLIIFAGVNFARTLFEGSPIGDSFITSEPEQSVFEFDFGNTVAETVVPLRIDRDFTIVEGGIILAIEKVELQFSYQQVVEGANFGVLRTFNFGFTTSLPDATRQKKPRAAQPSADTEEGAEDSDAYEVIEEIIEVPVEEVIEEAPTEEEEEEEPEEEEPEEEEEEEPEEPEVPQVPDAPVPE